MTMASSKVRGDAVLLFLMPAWSGGGGIIRWWRGRIRKGELEQIVINLNEDRVTDKGQSLHHLLYTQKYCTLYLLDFSVIFWSFGSASFL